MVSWLKLANKTAIVTGGGSGIGAAVVKALSQHGCHVIVADLLHPLKNTTSNKNDVTTTTRTKSSLSDNIIFHRCNVAEEQQVKELFQSCPPSSILINCAGITRDGWIGKMDTVKDWQSVLDVNLTGTFLFCREFLQQDHLSKTAKSSMATESTTTSAAIVNVSSVVALQGNLGQTNYAASKGGIWSFTKALAKEVAHRRIRVNGVAPGFIETPMVQAVPNQVQDVVRQKIALKRFGTPEEVANLILFLASCERSGYITGETIECSGMISL